MISPRLVSDVDQPFVELFLELVAQRYRLLAIPGGESITSFGEDDNGELYVVDASGGQIWRLEATPIPAER